MKQLIRFIAVVITMTVLPTQYTGAIEVPSQDYYDYTSPFAVCSTYTIQPGWNSAWICGRFANTIKIRYEYFGENRDEIVTVQPTIGASVHLTPRTPVYVTYTTHSNDIPDWDFSISAPEWSNPHSGNSLDYVRIDVFYLPGW